MKTISKEIICFLAGSAATLGLAALVSHMYETEIFNHNLRKLDPDSVWHDKTSGIYLGWSYTPDKVRIES